MSLDMSHTIDSIYDGTKEVAEAAHVKTSEFHEKYVSKVIPDCGKYGDAARFVAEMAPGVSEYNAIREGDWQSFAISAGIDVAAFTIGVFTAGTGYGAVKGGSVAAKASVKTATRELAEAGAKKAIKETAEAGAEKVVKEAAEAGAEKIVKEAAEAGAEKIIKETAEAGAEKAVKELAETGTEKAVKEIAEAGTEKAVKEITEAGAEKTAKEIAEDGIGKAVKEVDELSEIVRHKMEGIARENTVMKELFSEFGEKNVLREQYLRDNLGRIIKDPLTNEARRIDFIVREGDKVVKSIEVTSELADKTAQIRKTERILEKAKDLGGAFIKDFDSGVLIEFTLDLDTEIRRLP